MNDNLTAENKRLTEWVNDLQAGMYINCVYCEHRYGPDDEVPATMADALKEHIEQCSKHPMSVLKAERDAAIEQGRALWKHGEWRMRWLYDEHLKMVTSTGQRLIRQAEARVERLRAGLEPCLTYIEGTITAYVGESDREALNRVRSEILRVARAALEDD